MDQPDLNELFPDMQPITKAPGLQTINGIGTVLYGARDRHPETGTYVATRFFAVLFIPLAALDAYRVAKAQEGWYFLGRVPLGAFAKAWNLLIVTLIAAAIGSALWDAHTSSPEYIAGQTLEQAEEHLSGGRIAAAIPALVQVGQGGTRHAVQAKADLASILPLLPTADDPADLVRMLVGSAAPLMDPVAVQQAAVVAIDAASAAQPARALAILEVLPEARRPADASARRLSLLEQLHRQQPTEPRWAGALAVLAEAAGDRARCEALLTPIEDRLGSTEGARILGSIRAGQGRHEDAHRLLSAYCGERLKSLRQAEQLYTRSQEAVQTRAIDALKRGDAGDAWYKRYEAADEAGQQLMVNTWVVERSKNDKGLAAAEAALAAQAAIVPVALDLGIVTLQRAQGLAAEERQREMQAAEEVFLSIRGLAGESDEFHLFYGQVCWWLGRTDDGRKEMDALLAKHERKPEMLLMVSNALRSLGAQGEARAMAEEAYGAAKDPKVRQAAAMQRSLCQIDAEDQVLWLSRCDTTQPSVAASLASARGDVALAKGDRDTGIRELRSAIEAYKAMPRTPASLNNGALAAYALFECTGDRAIYADATGMMEAAIALDPADTILQSNLCHRLYSGGVMATIGNRVDQIGLGMAGSDDLMDYCILTEAERVALHRACASSDEMRRAIGYLDRLQVMFPREASVWNQSWRIRRMAGDVSALAALRDRLRQADLDLSSAQRAMEEFQSGKRDEQVRTTCAARVQRLSALCAARDLNGAIARAETVNLHLRAASIGVPAELDQVVALAEAAYEIAPSLGTRSSLLGALLHRAGERRSAADAAFAGWAGPYRRHIGWPTLVALAVARDDVLARDPDVQRVAELVSATAAAMPGEAGLWSWALLAGLHRPEAETLAAALRSDPELPLACELGALLSPYSADVAVQAVWLARLNGDGQAAAMAKPWRDRGVALPDLD